MKRVKDGVSGKLLDLILTFLFSLLSLLFKNIKRNSSGLEIFPNTLKLVISRQEIEKITIYISFFSFVLALYFLLKLIRKRIYVYKQTKQIQPSKKISFNKDNYMTSYIRFVYDDKLGYEIRVYNYFENVKKVEEENGVTHIDGVIKEKQKVDKLVCKDKECRSYMSSAPTCFYNYKYSCSVCDYEFKYKFNETTIKERMQKKIDSDLLNRRY